MKYDCGETWPEKKARLSNWHKFFCLWPRKVADHDCRWLEYIERQGELSYSSMDGFEWEWEYRAISKT
jgi:hypothetical protein